MSCVPISPFVVAACSDSSHCSSDCLWFRIKEWSSCGACQDLPGWLLALIPIFMAVMLSFVVVVLIAHQSWYKLSSGCSMRSSVALSRRSIVSIAEIWKIILYALLVSPHTHRIYLYRISFSTNTRTVLRFSVSVLWSAVSLLWELTIVTLWSPNLWHQNSPMRSRSQCCALRFLCNNKIIASNAWIVPVLLIFVLVSASLLALCSLWLADCCQRLSALSASFPSARSLNMSRWA